MTNVIKRASVAASKQGAQEITQPHVTTGFETCQDIQAIKEELARLQAIFDGKTLSNARQYGDAVNRYWAIRWVMGWEKEIPNV